MRKPDQNLAWNETVEVDTMAETTWSQISHRGYEMQCDTCTKIKNKAFKGNQRNCSEVSSCHPSRAPVCYHINSGRDRKKSSFPDHDLYDIILLLALTPE